MNVLEAARSRIKYLYDNFKPKEIWLSLSGGKDSTVCYYLMKAEAMRRGIKFINLLIIDLEGHYKSHIDFLKNTVADTDIEIRGYWVCLSFQLSNASSFHQPKWLCWDSEEKDIWIRDIPNTHITVHEGNNPFGDFFRKGMEFEEFIIEFPKYLVQSGLEKVAQVIGIRTDESYNRYLKMKVRKHREFFNGIQWMLKQKSTGVEGYSVHPVYDWRVNDVWRYLSDKPYAEVYDQMYKAGITLSQMRICQPYGEEQRDNIDLFAKIEPDTWAKIVNRVSGGNFAKIYKGKNVMKGRIVLPENTTWEAWARLILRTMPPYLRDHYLKKINVFIRWWRMEIEKDIPSVYSHHYQDNESFDNEGVYVYEIHDEHPGDTKKLKPSWRRIAKVLIKGDYLCKNLSFSATKKEYEKLEELKKKYNEML